MMDSIFSDSLISIPGITSIHINGKFDSENHDKLKSFLKKNPHLRAKLKLKRLSFFLFGKYQELKSLLDQFSAQNIVITTKLMIINSAIDTGMIFEESKLENMVNNPPEKLKQFSLIKGEGCGLQIRKRGLSAILFRSGRILFSTGAENDHTMFQKEILEAISV